jgi:hypothetical protein
VTTKLEINVDDLTQGQQKLLRSKSKQVLLAGGYGSGKTTGLDLKLLQLKSLNPNVPGLLVAPTRPLLFSVTVRRLMNLLMSAMPRDRLPKVVDPQGQCYLDFGDGIPIFLRSATRPDSIDGLDVGWACGDEVRYWNKQAYDVTLGRVRVKCAQSQCAFSSTPSMNWMHDEFNWSKSDRELIISGTKENEQNLTPGFIENLRASYSPRLQRAVIDGEFVVLEGAVFESFDSNPRTSPWIIDWQPTTRDFDRCKVMLAVDPGWRRSAWLFIIERAPLDWVVFDQMMLDNASDIEAVTRINDRVGKGLQIDEVWIDPAAGGHQSTTGIDTLTVVQNIESRNGQRGHVRSIGKYRDIAFGVDKARTLLGGYEGFPIRVHFTKRLVEEERGKMRGIVKDLASLRYHEMKDGRPISDVPLDDGVSSHSTDCFRYWAVSRWLVVPELRKRDPILSKDTHLGYKIAA